MKTCPRCDHEKCASVSYSHLNPANDKFFCTECGLKFKRYDEPEVKPEPKLKNYRLRWEIDIVAKSPVEAAKQAFKYLQSPETTSTCFDVQGEDHEWFIDLTYPEESRLES
jgi:hypothetical protein